MPMQIARLLYPVESLGPGKRVGIWVCGCNRACYNCANPELQKPDKTKEISISAIKELFHNNFKEKLVEGVTISGGEPFLQTKELCELVRVLSDYTDDILVFTGYRRETLLKRKKLFDSTSEVLSKIAVLVDGPYIHEKNDGHPLRGSNNQRLFYRDEKIRERYEAYIEKYKDKPPLQNFQTIDGIISVGIHKKDFRSIFQ